MSAWTSLDIKLAELDSALLDGVDSDIELVSFDEESNNLDHSVWVDEQQER